jgi:hypothetical protein
MADDLEKLRQSINTAGIALLTVGNAITVPE